MNDPRRLLSILFEDDEIGRTRIHDLVANSGNGLRIGILNYLDSIEKLINTGCDIDAQTCIKGKTALHLAVLYCNDDAIHGLLIAGADINISDTCNRTALAQTCKSMLSFDDVFITCWDGRKGIPEILAQQVIRLQLCGLEVSSKNASLTNYAISESKMQPFRQQILKELEDAKLVRIGGGSLTLRDFLSETGAVASRPSMASEADRQAIDKFFTASIDKERFPALEYLFKLQYRKMLTRLQLMDDATRSVRQLLGSVNGFSMPEICCRMILRFLTNTEVKLVINMAQHILVSKLP